MARSKAAVPPSFSASSAPAGSTSPMSVPPRSWVGRVVERIPVRTGVAVLVVAVHREPRRPPRRRHVLLLLNLGGRVDAAPPRHPAARLVRGDALSQFGDDELGGLQLLSEVFHHALAPEASRESFDPGPRRDGKAVVSATSTRAG